jgi:hypothetical protein
MTNRAAVDVDTLLKVVLVLVVIWLALEIVGEVIDIAFGIFGFLQPVIGLIILVLIVLWLLDRL